MKCNNILISVITVVVLNSSHMMAMNQASSTKSGSSSSSSASSSASKDMRYSKEPQQQADTARATILAPQPKVTLAEPPPTPIEHALRNAGLTANQCAEVKEAFDTRTTLSKKLEKAYRDGKLSEELYSVIKKALTEKAQKKRAQLHCICCFLSCIGFLSGPAVPFWCYGCCLCLNGFSASCDDCCFAPCDDCNIVPCNDDYCFDLREKRRQSAESKKDQ